VCWVTVRIQASSHLDSAAEFWTLRGKEAILSFVSFLEENMYAVIGNVLAGLLAISLFTATIRLSK
jgi:hypothetical protein